MMTKNKTYEHLSYFEYHQKDGLLRITKDVIRQLGIEVGSSMLMLDQFYPIIHSNDIVKFNEAFEGSHSSMAPATFRFLKGNTEGGFLTIVRQGLIEENEGKFKVVGCLIIGRNSSTLKTVDSKYVSDNAYNNQEPQKQVEERLPGFMDTQNQLLYNTKYAALGTQIEGVVHELCNSINFISSGAYGIEKNIPRIKETITHFHGQNIDGLEDQKVNLYQNKLHGLMELLDHFEMATMYMNSGVERTIDIIKGVQFYATSDSKKLNWLKIHQCIDSLLIILRNRYKDRIQMIKNLADTPEVKCYIGLINQVLLAILLHAIQSIEDKGTITIESGLYSKKHIFISIKDTGRGIKEKELKYIFDPAINREGVELFQAKEIITMHHGDIIAKSTPGQGSEFIVILPINQS